MESWSAQLEKFKINFFLDTNILCYLIDNTYPSLTTFISELAKMPIVSLYSSEYVLSELIGVRKQEGYFQEALCRSFAGGAHINLASFINNNKKFDIPNYPYRDLAESVKVRVESDIDRIVHDFNIQFNCNFNDKILLPMQYVCLSTRISREDSLVLVSSVYKNSAETIADSVILLTNDHDFYKWAKESMDEIVETFTSNGLKAPVVEHLSSVGTATPNLGSCQNLTNNIEDVSDFAKRYVTRCFMASYEEKYYIGKIIVRECPNAPRHLIGIKVSVPQLCNGIYLTILSKSLSFLYCPQNKVDFYHCGQSIGESFSPLEGDSYVSFICDEDNEEIFNKVNSEGNLVYIHPDSIGD